MVVVLMVWAISCAINPVTGKRELMLLSSADELAMGQQSDPQILQTFGKYEDADLARYVTALGKKLGALSHQPNLTYTIQVLDSPVVNAFAVPGGYVYLTRGILAYLNVKADRLTVRKTSRQGSLRQTLKTLGVPEDKLEAHAILNGMKLDDALPGSTIIKIVVK